MCAYGVVTRNEADLHHPEFEAGFFECKDVTGRTTDPVTTGVNMVSCFGDNARAEDHPDWVAVDPDGQPATRERPYFDWAYICPNRDPYTRDIIETIRRCAATNPAVRLDDVGFPRSEYCHCEECNERFATSEFEDRGEWRASVITRFTERATDAIPGRVYFTLYPDPYPGHLHARSGIDLDAIAEQIDEFVVPIYDMAYATTYWIEALAAGFTDALSKPFSVELYAVNIDVDNLVRAARVASNYADSVYFAYDADTARQAVQRMRRGDATINE